MRLPILVLNAGSSSIKFSVFETARDHTLAPRLHGQVEGIGDTPHLTVEDATVVDAKAGGATGGKLADQTLAGADHEQAIGAILDWFAAHVGSEAGFDGVGHRVVHGGHTYARPTLIDAQVLENLQRLVPLAPLHQPHQIAAMAFTGCRTNTSSAHCHRSPPTAPAGGWWWRTWATARACVRSMTAVASPTPWV